MSKFIMYLAIAALCIAVDALPTSPSNVDALVPEVDFAEKGTAADTAADFAPAWSVCKETDECKEAKPAQDSDYQATFDKCFEGGMTEGSGCFKCKECIDDNLVNENQLHGGMKHSGCFQCKKCIDDETAKEHKKGEEMLMQETPEGGFTGGVAKDFAPAWKKCKDTACKDAKQAGGFGPTLQYCLGGGDVPEVDFAEKGTAADTAADFAPAWSVCKETDECKEAKPAQDSDYQATFDKCFEGGMIEGSGCFKCKKCIDDNLVNENKPHGGMKHSGCFQCKKCIDDETAKEHNAGSTTMSLDQTKVVKGKKSTKKGTKNVVRAKSGKGKGGGFLPPQGPAPWGGGPPLGRERHEEEMLMQETPEGGFTGGVEKDFAPAWNKCKDTACKDAEQVGGFGPTLKYCLGR